jgi:OOP family OmpA-OmpF porin
MDKNMKISRFTSVVGLVLSASLFGSAVSAAESDWRDEGWYIGGGIGKTYANIDDERIISGLLADGFTTTGFSSDDTDRGFKLFAGYQFSSYFAVEGGYFDLGTHGYTATTAPAGTLTGEIDLRGINVDAVGLMPLGERFSLLGRIGANYAEADTRFSGSGAVTPLASDSSNKDINLKLGVGGQWDFSRNVAMRLEYERFRIDDAVGNSGDIDLASLGLLVRFGGERAPARRVAPAAAPAPAPVLVVAPVPASTERYCGILDIQFEVDMSAIQREEKERLSTLATFMNKYPKTTAIIEGHTDNVGNAADNLALSRERAQSVVDYLVSTHRIARSRLSAVGYGETRPLADNRTEAGKRANRRIGAVIACVTDIEGLQPLPAQVTMAMHLEFEHDRADIGRQHHAGLQRIVNYLKANPGITVTVEGHADNTSAAKAMDISRLRARNVADYLVESGIARSRVSSQGFGETRRFAYNTTAEGRQENRRVNIIFNYPRADRR